MRQLTAIAVVALAVGGWIGLKKLPHDDAEAMRLLQLAAQAPTTQAYTAQAATFAAYNGGVQSEATIYNAPGCKFRIEYRLGPLAGVVWGRNGPGMSWHYDPQWHSLVTAMEATPQSRSIGIGDLYPRADIVGLLNNCQARLDRYEPVAGRDAARIHVVCRTNGAARDLWIDRQTGVILRSETRDADHILSAMTVYHTIDYGHTAPPDRFLPIPPNGTPVHWMPESDFAVKLRAPEQAQKAIGATLAKPHFVPAGYTQEGYYVYRCPSCSMPSAITRYVNGMDALTIVQTHEASGAHTSTRPFGFGMGRAVYEHRGNSSFWVLGNLPEGDLKQVLESLHS